MPEAVAGEESVSVVLLGIPKIVVPAVIPVPEMKAPGRSPAVLASVTPLLPFVVVELSAVETDVEDPFASFCVTVC